MHGPEDPQFSKPHHLLFVLEVSPGQETHPKAFRIQQCLVDALFDVHALPTALLDHQLSLFILQAGESVGVFIVERAPPSTQDLASEPHFDEIQHSDEELPCPHPTASPTYPVIHHLVVAPVHYHLPCPQGSNAACKGNKGEHFPEVDGHPLVQPGILLLKCPRHPKLHLCHLFSAHHAIRPIDRRQEVQGGV